MLIRQLLIFLSVSLLLSCGRGHERDLAQCEQLKRNASVQETADYLLGWVEEKIKSKKIPVNEYEYEYMGTRRPGLFSVKSDVDWSRIGLDPQIAGVRMVGPAINSETIDVTGSVKSFFFGDRTGFGYVVPVAGGDLGLSIYERAELTESKTGIYVLCVNYRETSGG